MLNKKQQILLDNFANKSDVLFSLGIITTDSFTGEIGEYFVYKYFNLKKSDRSTKAVDGVSLKGEKFQIKAKIVKQNRFNYGFKNLQTDLFDQLAVVYFDKLYNPIKILLIPSGKIQNGEIRITKTNISSFQHIDGEKIKISENEKNAINDFALAYNSLENNKIIRSRHIVGDIGEIYACIKLDLIQNVNKSEKGFDATHANGLTFEIKSRRVYESGRRFGKTRRINNLVGKSADYLVVVVLDRSFRCSGMWLIPIKNIANPKSAKLEIVNTTRGTLNIVPSKIPWLQSGQAFISFRKIEETGTDLRQSISKKSKRNEPFTEPVSQSNFNDPLFLDDKQIMIIVVIILGILYTIGKLSE